MRLAFLFLAACVAAPDSSSDPGPTFAADVYATTSGNGSAELEDCTDRSFSECGHGVDAQVAGQWQQATSLTIAAAPGDVVWTRWVSPDGTPMARLRFANAIGAITPAEGASITGGVVHAAWGTPDPVARVDLDVSLDCGAPQATTIQLGADPGAYTIDLVALGFTVGTDCDAQLTVHRVIVDDATELGAELTATADVVALGPHFTVSR